MKRAKQQLLAFMLLAAYVNTGLAEPPEVLLENVTLYHERIVDWTQLCFEMPLHGGLDMARVEAIKDDSGFLKSIVVSSDEIDVTLSEADLAQYPNARLHTLRLYYYGESGNKLTWRLLLKFNFGDTNSQLGQIWDGPSTYDDMYASVTFFLLDGVVESTIVDQARKE